MGNNLAYQEESWDELIDGKLVAMSPRPSVNHHQVSLNIANIFSRYLKGKTCRPFGDGVDLYLTEKDRFIPDGMIVCDPRKIGRDGIYGAPDLVVEVLSPARPAMTVDIRRMCTKKPESVNTGSLNRIQRQSKSIC